MMRLRFWPACVLLVAAVSISPAAVKPREPGQDVQYGPCLCSAVTFVMPQDANAPTWDGAVTRAMTVALPGGAAMCYDMDRLAVAGLWRGGLLDRSKTHHTSYKGGLPPRPGAPVLYQNTTDPGWLGPDGRPADVTLQGYSLHNDRVVLSYQVSQRDVLETPGAGVQTAFSRTLRVGPGKTPVSMVIAGIRSAKGSATAASAELSAGEATIAARLTGEIDGLRLTAQRGQLRVGIPAQTTPRRFTVWLAAGKGESGDALNKEIAKEAATSEPPDPSKMLAGGRRRWEKAIVTKGTLAADDAAYVMDDLSVPDSPWGSWMRLSAIGAFDDGRLAVATMAGDVWIVSWEKPDLSEIRWRRFATGLYEPLGLKIVDGVIHARGRDRITRLVDRNGDGEADWFENFHSRGPIGPGYHAFLFDLVTDKAGNFYFAVSGRKAPTLGQVVKVSPDGKRRETVATRFRHANGLGAGGPYDWVTVADNPEGPYPSGASIVRRGGQYGYQGPLTVPMLYVLPPIVDTSSGSQCWSDPKRFGPLSSTLWHTSFSKCNVCYVMAQNVDPHPNGFAVKMPLHFNSGAMRLRVSPADGQLYIAGQRGWDTAAAVDGSLNRIRYTGKPAYLVRSAAATPEGVKLTFSCPLDPSLVNVDNFYAERVGPKQSQELDINGVKRLDERTVLVDVAGIDPAETVDRQATKKAGAVQYRVLPPLAISFTLKATDGTPIKQTVYATINSR